MRAAWAALLLAVTIAPALAQEKVQEKIFKLKNGRTVQGEVVEETATQYVVRRADGKIAIPKPLVVSVSDAPATPAPRGETPAPRAEPAPPPPPPPVRPSPPSAGPREAPRPPAADPNRPPELLATVAEVESARSVLTDLFASEPDRARAIASARARVPLRVLAVIASEPTSMADRRRHASAPERVLAVEVLATSKAEEVRPLLARALASARFEDASPDDLVRLIQRVGDGEPGLIERAAIARLDSLVHSGKPIERILPVVEAVGGVASLGSLYSWLVAPDTRTDAVPTIARSARALVKRQGDADVALGPLASLIADAPELPEWSRLGAALGLLGESKGKMDVAIGRVLARARAARVPPDEERAWNDCLANGCDALAAIGSPAARDQLLANLADAPTEERRVAILHAISSLSAADTDDAFLSAVVDFMAETIRTAKEVTAAGRALRAITHKKIGDQAAEWRTYLESRRH